MEYRLPQSVKPLKYTVCVEPISPNYNYFNGHCIIQYNDDTHQFPNLTDIYLNSSEIVIKQIYLKSEDKFENIIYPKFYSENKKTQIIKIVFPHIPSNGFLFIEYVGLIHDEPIGFCRVREGGEWIFYTQFEPTHARTVFPCFDEPEFKAIFNIELVVPKNKSVLSNTTISDSVILSGKIKYYFESTPIMSTYLIAFYIGFCKNIGTTVSGIQLRIHSNEYLFYQKYLLDQVVNAIELISSSFQFPYVLPKMDLVYVPKLDASAMENWGLIIIKRNNAIVYNCDQKPYIPILYQIDDAYTVYHEMVHQWFGNLVTEKWWSELWLSESFATTFGWMYLDQEYPEWQVNNQYYLQEIQQAFQMDCFLSSPAICAEANTLIELNAIFNVTNYSKGAAIITMLMHYIGKKNFMLGIQNYLQKYQYSNTCTENLLECLEICGKTVKPFATWFYQKNYPIINVTIKDKLLYLTQESFTLIPNSQSVIWPIPLSDQILFDQKTAVYQIEQFPIKINKNAFGFYITNYDPPILRHLLKNKFEQLSMMDLVEIINNINFCLRTSRLTFDHYLEFLREIMIRLIGSKPSGIFTKMITSHFIYFKNIIRNNGAIIEYEKIIKPYVLDILDRFGVSFSPDLFNQINVNSDVDIVVSRKNALKLAFYLGIPKYLSYFNQLFDQYQKAYLEAYLEGKSLDGIIHPYITAVVVNNALINRSCEESDAVFHFLKKMWNEGNTSFTVYHIIMTRNPSNYQEILNIIFSDKINSTTKLVFLQSAGKNIKLNRILWEFVQDNWDYIFSLVKNTQLSTMYLTGIFSLMIDTDNLQNEINHFFSDKDIMPRALEKIKEHIIINTNFNNLFQ